MTFNDSNIFAYLRNMIVNNKLGITLSGGGFKGIAHIGILQYINELGLEIHAVSGASAGALIGAFVAAGFTPLEILELAKTEKFFSYADVSLKSDGLFSADIFEKVIKKYIPHDSFKDLKMPLYVSVTDLTHAESLIFNQGSLSFAIKASCCFPLVFQPVAYKDNRYLCDGGILNNFPVEQIKATCNKNIGININPTNRSEGRLNYKQIVERIIRITTSNIKLSAPSDCDVFLQPQEINQFNTFDTGRIDEIYEFGYKYAHQFEKEFLALKQNLG